MSASTTAKVTKKSIPNLVNIFLHGDGLIVRFKGIEYGAIGYFQGAFTTIEGVVLDATKCTIRKGLPEVGPPETQQQFLNNLLTPRIWCRNTLGSNSNGWNQPRTSM